MQWTSDSAENNYGTSCSSLHQCCTYELLLTQFAINPQWYRKTTNDSRCIWTHRQQVGEPNSCRFTLKSLIQQIITHFQWSLIQCIFTFISLYNSIYTYLYMYVPIHLSNYPSMYSTLAIWNFVTEFFQSCQTRIPGLSNLRDDWTDAVAVQCTCMCSGNVDWT